MASTSAGTGLPREALEEDPSVDGDWRSVRVDVVGAISGKTVDTVQKNIEDRIREDDVNFICVYLDSAGGSPVDEIKRLGRQLESGRRVADAAWLEALSDDPGEFLHMRLEAEHRRRMSLGLVAAEEGDPW